MVKLFRFVFDIKRLREESKMNCCCSLAGTSSCYDCINSKTGGDNRYGKATYVPYQYPNNPDPLYPTYLTTKKEGWVCPKCGAVMANWMPSCVNCTGKKEKENK